MARTKQPKELAELNGATGKNPQRYKTRGSSKPCTKVHATKPKFRNNETGWAWDSIVPALENLKILTLQDLPTLNEMFKVYDNLIDSEAQLQRFMESHDIDEVNNDKVLISNQRKIQDSIVNYHNVWIKFSARFGLTPSDRNNIAIPDSGEDDPLAVVLGD
jgi:phage terminase small subunit